MKKSILKSLAVFLLFSFSATSAEFTGGIKLGAGEVTGKDTTSTTLNQTERNADSGFASLFIEATLPTNLPFGLSAGIEYIPIKAVIDGFTENGKGATGASKLPQNKNDDFEATVSNHTTLYLIANKELQQGFSAFGKIGYVRADISDVSTAQATLTSNDGSMSGYNLGFGIQKSLDNFVDYVRLGYDYNNYGSVKAASSSKNYSADVTSQALYLAVGKKF